ncbi:hypothetical protein F5Y19DRAFT_184639 [Xylariaceae sp. FL1651]|nr:hypothetical protein F5Y19DRAFT_184639 [Xylariaceae sp. FL1651]
MSPILQFAARQLVARTYHSVHKSSNYGSHRGSSSNSYHDNYDDYDDDDYDGDDGDDDSGLPWWAIAILVYLGIVLLLFFSSLIFYCVRENRRKKNGQPFRAGHAVWKAFCVATGLWFWIWLFKKCGCCGGASRKSAGAASGGTYEKVEGGQAPPPPPAAAAAAPASYAPAPTAAAPPPAGPNAPAWYGVPANQNTAYAPYGQPAGKFEPLGYNPPPVIQSHQPFVQHNAIPMDSFGPSPSPGPGMAPPPPYMGNAPPGPQQPFVNAPMPAAYGQNAQHQYVGPAY